ncbi:SGNH/GDSL hydrolase family protein [Campylobacter vulpis]|nr:SGNH/GDSL hydrolase family protein [Campylobacter vulpis]
MRGGGGVEFHNFALGGSRSSQKIYALIANEKVIKEADLVIIETNLNEYDNFVYDLRFDILQRDFEILCKMLANLNKPILFILLPLYVNNDKFKITNNFNLLQIKKYNFHFIDMQRYYDENNLNEFFATNDLFHQISPIMRLLGQNIALNLGKIGRCNLKCNYSVPKFLAVTLQDLFENINQLEKSVKSNSLFTEELYRLEGKIKLKFKKEFKNYTLVAFSVWNDDNSLGTFSSAIWTNKKTKIIKYCLSSFLMMYNLIENFVIDEESFLYFNANNQKQSENNLWIFLKDDCRNTLDCMQLANQILLVKPDENFTMDTHYDFQTLANLEVQIDEKYNFSHLIPDVVLFKEIIEEYNARMDPVKIAPFQAEIKNLKLELHQKKQNPIQTHLAHKLGRAIIENYRSFWGFLGLPFVLNYIAKKHKKKPAPLPCTENEKQILSYQLGLALINAHKAWYKGGYIWFIFKVLSLKKKFRR